MYAIVIDKAKEMGEPLTYLITIDTSVDSNSMSICGMTNKPCLALPYSQFSNSLCKREKAKPKEKN